MDERCQPANFRKPIERAGTVLLLIALSACVMTSTKDIAVNPRAHAESDFFAPQKLQDAVSREILQGERVALNFQRMSLTYGHDEKFGYVVHLINAGNGLVRSSRENFRDQVPSGSLVSLSYLGVVPLRAQNVPYNSRSPALIEEVTEFTRFSKQIARPVENAEYLFEGRTGLWLTLLSEKSSMVLACRSEKFYPAGKLHPEMRGDAIDLVCTQSSPLRSVHRYAFLSHYGVAVPREAWAISKFEVI